jgi:hypothetical protein
VARGELREVPDQTERSGALYEAMDNTDKEDNGEAREPLIKAALGHLLLLFAVSSERRQVLVSPRVRYRGNRDFRGSGGVNLLCRNDFL